LLGFRRGLEVGVVALEAGPTGENVVGEERDVGVVVLDQFIVAAALDGDAVFGAGQLILQAKEIFVGAGSSAFASQA
jgi:hypothetical protein